MRVKYIRKKKQEKRNGKKRKENIKINEQMKGLQTKISFDALHQKVSSKIKRTYTVYAFRP